VLLNGVQIMAITHTNDPEPTTTAVVTIRIPCGADGDLVANAEERLSQPREIDDVSVDELHGIEPQLSATIITIGVILRWTTPMVDSEARARLAEAPGLESIGRIG
jgi:hypothetical protein